MKIQGPRPNDKEQKLWAPFMYFVHSVAGSMIAMMHKLGMFRLRINYGVADVSNYLKEFLQSTLACFIDGDDENHVNRYYQACQCRIIAETVLRSTFSSMMIHDDLDSAIVYAMQSVTYNALHLSLLPVMHERFIQRIVKLEPLLGICTLGLMLRVPVVSVRSILEVMNGRRVTDEDDRRAMRQYILLCLEGQGGLQMLPYVGKDAYCNPSNLLPGYITCGDLTEVCSGVAGDNGGGGGGGGGGFRNYQQQQHEAESAHGSGNMFSTVSPNGVPMKPIMNVCSRIYSTQQKVLTNCAFIKDLLGFKRCILSLMRVYDLREFFGGMSCYHDGASMARALDIPNPGRFMDRYAMNSSCHSRSS